MAKNCNRVAIAKGRVTNQTYGFFLDTFPYIHYIWMDRHILSSVLLELGKKRIGICGGHFILRIARFIKQWSVRNIVDVECSWFKKYLSII